MGCICYWWKSALTKEVEHCHKSLVLMFSKIVLSLSISSSPSPRHKSTWSRSSQTRREATNRSAFPSGVRSEFTEGKKSEMDEKLQFLLVCLFVCLFCFLGLLPWPMEVPRLGVKSEL